MKSEWEGMVVGGDSGRCAKEGAGPEALWPKTVTTAQLTLSVSFTCKYSGPLG